MTDYRNFLKPETQEYYLFSSYQYTVKALPGNNLKDILSQEGLKLFDELNQQVHREEVVKHPLLNYKLSHSNSGPWESDQNSLWYSSPNNFEPEIRGILNTFNNVCVQGNVAFVDSRWKIGEIVTTSPCVFIVEPTATEDGWCYTKSGSLYVLNKLE
jgi:hypothetical protein